MAFVDIGGRSVAYRLLGEDTQPLLVLAHPLGMTQAVWDDVVPALLPTWRVLTWDLPGHGASAAWGKSCGRIDPAQLAGEVLALVEHAGVAEFDFVGTSIGGIIGQQLLLQAPTRVGALALTNTGPVIGTPEFWKTRARQVRTRGLASLAEELVSRWFAERTRQRRALATGWQTQLSRTDDESYALLCEMLARADYRGRLSRASRPVCLLAGRDDIATPPGALEQLARELGAAPPRVLEDVGHVPQVESPEAFARFLLDGLVPARADVNQYGVAYADGLARRKQVLGEEHVARAIATTTTLDAPFQHMITRLAWGELWGNSDLSRVERSLITVAILAVLGRDGELEMHLRTARRLGVAEVQVRQALMHVAVYGGLPAANRAFALAKKAGWGEPLVDREPSLKSSCTENYRHEQEQE